MRPLATTLAVSSLLSFLTLAPGPASARVEPFPPAFKNEMTATNGTKLYVRVGGKGPAVVLLHGYGETGDMWAPLAAKLARDHTVIVPDLRGMGLSERPAGGPIKRLKGRTLPGFSTRSRSRRPISSPTTSATWSATPSPRNTPIA